MLESLDQTILLGFTEEAQSYLPVIRQGLELAQRDAASEDVQLAYRHTHTIRGAALMVGLSEISEFAERIESVLEKCIAEQANVTKKQATKITDDLDCLETLINETVEALKAEMANAPEGAFLYEDDFAQFADNPMPMTAAPETFEGGDEDLDPEMLEVFALEAEDLLRNISESLRLLEENAQNMEALREIRRSSHTLKGAAGVCGFRTVSKLAHRMEDLLDHLAENPQASNSETTALILASTDVLERMTRGAHENALRKEIDRLYASYDILLEQTASAAVHPTETSLLESPVETYETLSSTETERFVAPETINFRTPQGMSQSSAQNSPAAASAAPRAVVRVGLERLDELVKLIGEMVISRTTLEQRLAEVEQQLSELQRSTTRLRRISGKLEIDYEASALAGGNAFSGGFATQFLAAKNTPGVVEKHGFDALEFDRYTEFHQLTRELSETTGDTASISNEMDDLVSTLEGALARQRRISEEMQEKLMRLRMVPLSSLAPRLDRTVRVTAQQENKLADFVIDGEQVELDTQVLDSLAEPLLHLLRNSVGHGLETPEERRSAGKSERGEIRLSAHHEGTHVVLKIKDDGRGININRLREKVVEFGIMSPEIASAMPDEEAVALVFLPGLSTAKEVSEVSGRGVGMDVVRESVMRQQGTISIKSVWGEGTTVTIRLPMSLAVTRALLVKAYGERFAIPVSAISQLVQVGEEDIFTRDENKFVRVEDETYPVCSLNSLLNLPEQTMRDEPYVPLLIVKTADETVAIALDQTLEAREIVIKPFDALLRQIRGLLGATLLGDGSVIPILDLFALVQKSEAQSQMSHVWSKPVETFRPKATRLNVMIVDDSPSVRRVMTNLITKTGWDATAAKDGLEALEMLQTARQLPDVILSDVEMPRMDGYELIATLKRLDNLQHIPVVVITSRAGEKHRRKALDMGASEYITKPYTDTALLETVKNLAKA